MKHLFFIPLMVGLLVFVPTKTADAQVIPPPRVQAQNITELRVNFRIGINARRIKRRINRTKFNFERQDRDRFTTDIQVIDVEREVSPERRRSRTVTTQYAVYFNVRKVGRRSVNVSGYYFKIDPALSYGGLSGAAPPRGIPPEPWKNISGPRSGSSDFDRDAYVILRRFASSLKL